MINYNYSLKAKGDAAPHNGFCTGTKMCCSYKSLLLLHLFVSHTVQRKLPSPSTEKLSAAVDTGLTGALWDQE